MEKLQRSGGPASRRSPGQIEVLGPLRLLVEGVEMPVPRAQQGRLLRSLLLHPDEAVEVGALVAELWPGIDPQIGRRRLQLTASRLRRRLPAGLRVEAVAGGYRITAHPQAIDRLTFEELARKGLQGDTSSARAALALWKDEPYLGFEVTDEMQRERQRLVTLRARLQAALNGRRPRGPSAGGSVAARAEPDGWQVERSRLLDGLPSVGALRLLGVTAPSGYGKTAMLRQWVRREGCPVAWISLTPAHDSVQALGEAVAAAVARAFEQPITGAAAVGAGASTADLVNELDRRAQPMLVVVDDLHTITRPETQQALWDLVRHCPRHVTVTMASRQALPFPTSRLEAVHAFRLVEAPDLAFTGDELEAVVDRMVSDGGRRTPSSAEWLQSTTGGWPAPAIVVASAVITGGHPQDEEAAISLLAAWGMLDRVFADVPIELATLMEQTAHLEDLNPSICEAVTGVRGAAEALRALATRHCLVVPHGSDYRHNRLLARLLRWQAEERDDSSIRGRHRRAARWYLDEGRPDRALDHASAADDQALVARSLDPAIRLATASADSDALTRWADAVTLPEVLVSDMTEPLLLACALLPRDRRARWRSDRTSDPVGVVRSTMDAIDLVRAGRCREALAAVIRTRRLLERTSAATPESPDAVLWLAEMEARLLLDGDTASFEAAASVPRDTHGGTWPWLTLWAHGMRAAAACAARDHGLAAAMLRHARHRVGPLHPSWRRLTRGYLIVAETFSGMTTGNPPGATVRTLDDLVDRSDRSGEAPMGIMARYALHLTHQRRGNTEAAARRLAEADIGRAHHPDLAFLSRLRALAVGPTVRPPTRVPVADLSPRERMVLRYLDSDLTLAQIADDLYLSVHTVKTHTRSIYRKLGVSSRAEAVTHGLSGA